MSKDFTPILKSHYRKLVSPGKDYQQFRKQKNKLLSLLSNEKLDIMNPSVSSIVEVLGQDINIVTEEENLNIIMFICLWAPFMRFLAEEWIDCFISAGVDMDHKSIYGLST